MRKGAGGGVGNDKREDVERSFRGVERNSLGKCSRTWAWFQEFVERSQPGGVLLPPRAAGWTQVRAGGRVVFTQLAMCRCAH